MGRAERVGFTPRARILQVNYSLEWRTRWGVGWHAYIPEDIHTHLPPVDICPTKVSDRRPRSPPRPRRRLG